MIILGLYLRYFLIKEHCKDREYILEVFHDIFVDLREVNKIYNLWGLFCEEQEVDFFNTFNFYSDSVHFHIKYVSSPK